MIILSFRMEKTPVSDFMANVMLEVTSSQSELLNDENERKRQNDLEFDNRKKEFLRMLLDQIMANKNKKYIIFKVPDPNIDSRILDFAIEEIYRMFNDKYVLFGLSKREQDFGDAIFHRNTRLWMDCNPIYKSWSNQTQSHTFNSLHYGIYMLYDKRRCVNYQGSMSLTYKEFVEATK